MLHRITVLPQQVHIEAAAEDNLLTVLRQAGLAPDAPCGGLGRCGKCKVCIDDNEVLACRVTVDRDLTVTIPGENAQSILIKGVKTQPVTFPAKTGYLLAFDIGTTTVVGFLLDGKNGSELASASACNPQSAYGADCISRIRYAIQDQMEALTGSIRNCLEEITLELCQKTNVSSYDIQIVSIVGNPAMQQMFLGVLPDNLVKIPFAPALTQAKTVPASAYMPLWKNAELLIVPDISGYVGADTVSCILATKLNEQEDITLLVDIGTNGEMVLGNKHRMVCCSAAAGPALEGANIQFGMRGQTGAIDHVWAENGSFRYSVIGNVEPTGICGSGLIDAVASALDMGLINERGNIQNQEKCIRITDRIFLTQEDIRQVQLAKGAIAAGIELMAARLSILPENIHNVYLAGAFGTFMNPDSACRIGLLPSVRKETIHAIGNAAGSGAKLLACNRQLFSHTQQIVSQTEFMELAAVPGFQRCFAKNMRFSNGRMDR